MNKADAELDEFQAAPDEFYTTCEGGTEHRLEVKMSHERGISASDLLSGSYKWACPVCYRDGWWVKRAKDVHWATHGGGISVCKRCAKKFKDHIDKHNWLYHGKPGAKIDRDCDHEWGEPYPGRFYCHKCHGQFNWMCGCGGSMYVCPEHYESFMKKIGDLDEYLAENAR